MFPSVQEILQIHLKLYRSHGKSLMEVGNNQLSKLPPILRNLSGHAYGIRVLRVQRGLLYGEVNSDKKHSYKIWLNDGVY